MLRVVENFEISRRMMGGTDDGIRPFEAVSLFYSGICIANAVNISRFDDVRAQVMVCETCGEVGCGSGGWVHLRTVGLDVVWIPPRRLTAIDERFEWQDEPPQYFASNVFGIPVFPGRVYEELRRQLPWFPEKSAIEPIRTCEALALLQSDAPLELLGRAPGVPRLQRERILAVSKGDTGQEIDIVDVFLRDYEGCETAMRPVEVDAIYRQIEFHLDAPRFPAWSGFCHLSAGIGIMLRPWRPLKMEPNKISP